ncbi:MAG: hypothetical protein AB7N80_11620 [Bdellovibrionales bacterium]
MKTILLFTTILSLPALAVEQDFSSFATGVTPNPAASANIPVPAPARSTSLEVFTQGLVHNPLTESQIRDLEQYLDSSREKLDKALRQARGRTSLEAIALYEKAILEVVPTSNRRAGAVELLMRMSLNQGLDLVTGVPGESRQAALRYSQNTGLKAQVLEGAIRLAIKFFMEPKGLRDDALSRLPFRELGWNRLHQTLRWWGGIEDSAVALEFVERSLGHWLAIAEMAKNDVPLMAQEMVDVSRILNAFKSTRSEMANMSGAELDEKLRELRGDFTELLLSLQRKAQAR